MIDKDIPQNQDDTADQQTELSGQDIFDVKFQKLMGIFGEACEKEGIELAVAIAMFPPLNKEETDKLVQNGHSPLHPMVFYRGHLADVAALQANVLRGMKAEIINSMNID